MFDPKRVGSHPDLSAAGDAAYTVLSDRVAAETKQGEDHEARSVGCWALVHGLACLFLDGQISDRISGPDDDVTRRVVEAALKDTC